MVWTPLHRKRSHLARKVRYRAGEAAYRRFKATGKVPAGLNSMLPRSRKNRRKRVRRRRKRG